MKTSIYFTSVLISFLTLTTIYAQQKDAKSNTILKIKKIYQQINQYKNYKTVTIDNVEDFTGHSTDNGGSLKGYYKGDTLKKIVEWIGLSNKVIQNEYYFNNNQLVFVYATESRYRFNQKSQNFDYSKLDNTYKGRYYFDNEKLIDTIFYNSENTETKETETRETDAANFLSSGKEYMQFLKEKRNR